MILKTILALPELELSFSPHYSSAKEQTLAWACDKHFSLLRFWYTLDFKGNCKPVGLSALDDWNPGLCLWKLGGELFPAIWLLTFQFVSVHQLPQHYRGEGASAILIQILHYLEMASRQQQAHIFLTYHFLPLPSLKICMRVKKKKKQPQPLRLIFLRKNKTKQVFL